MPIRKVQIPQFFYFHTVRPEEGAPDGVQVSMTSEELRPEFLQLALEAQLRAIKEEHADDPAFGFVKSEDTIVGELVEFAYREDGQ